MPAALHRLFHLPDACNAGFDPYTGKTAPSYRYGQNTQECFHIVDERPLQTSDFGGLMHSTAWQHKKILTCPPQSNLERVRRYPPTSGNVLSCCVC